MVPGLALIAVTATVLSAYGGAQAGAAAQPAPPPAAAAAQPAPTAPLDTAALRAQRDTLPAVGTCMGCHQVVRRDSPEIQKLAQYWADSTPVPWVRIHKVPDYVQFPHMRHVNANVSCQTCHGEVQKMPRVYQYASLNMGWCVNCHVERKARYDCATCHY